jgi:hypothetical protein
MPERQLRKTIEAVERAIGPLRDGYHEPDAIRLIKAIGNCDAFIAPAFAHRHTADQEQARRRLHQVCLELSGAIRQAIGYPGRPEHESRVVGLVHDLQAALETLFEVFGWRDAVPATADRPGAASLPD